MEVCVLSPTQPPATTLTNHPKIYSYNQGVFVSGASTLYLLTKDEKYLDEARETIDAVMSITTANGILRLGIVDGILLTQCLLSSAF